MTQPSSWSDLKVPLILIVIASPFALMKCVGDAQEKADKARAKAAEVVVTAPQPQSIREVLDSKPTMSYEQGVRKAWEDADKSNREADAAQDALIESYRRRAVSSETSSGIGARIDTFIMPDGKVVYCRTTVRNNARATSCR